MFNFYGILTLKGEHKLQGLETNWLGKYLNLRCKWGFGLLHNEELCELHRYC